MPRKKPARQAEAELSSQPLKKFKSDLPNSSAGESVGRRSLRTRSQDENRADGNVPVRETRASPRKAAKEVGVSRLFLSTTRLSFEQKV